ncbi:hypothetical protein BDN70DRAFT_883381, partial [Pholiota conissans]
MRPKQFFCDCTEYCLRNGATQPLPVSYATWYNHAKYRIRHPPPLEEFLAQQSHVHLPLLASHEVVQLTHVTPVQPIEQETVYQRFRIRR